MLDKSIQDKINKRLESNELIINKLSEYIHKYPDIRFGQALVNLNIICYDDTQLHNVIDPFYDESIDILNRIN